jgi:alanine racemase
MGLRNFSVPDAVRVWAQVDLEAVRHNTRVLRGLLKHGAALMAVVKSEAYGHGAVPVAKAALSAGATRLGVNEISEGIDLRDAGIGEPVQLLTSCLPQELDAGIEADLTFSVSSQDEIKALAEHTRALNQGLRRGLRTKVHLMVDTGMGRGGFWPDEVWPAADWIKQEKTLDLEGIFTHFSSAEEPDPAPTGEQVATFRKLLRYHEERNVRFKIRHAANSAGTVFHPESQLDMVRCGVLLHGLRAWPPERDGLELLPSLSLYTRIIHIGRRPTGTTVGYNRRHVCRKDSVLATLPVGYGDGYRRALTGRCNVIVRGVQVPVLGTISMNCIVIDLTALENSSVGLPEKGEIVTLIGGSLENRITVEDIAEKSGTIPYVVTTQLGGNVERRHINAGEVRTQDQAFELRQVAAPSVVPLDGLAVENQPRDIRRVASA